MGSCFHGGRASKDRCAAKPRTDPLTLFLRGNSYPCSILLAMIKVVSFDVGDTLARPYPSFGEVALRGCAEAGHPLPPESVPRLVALADEHFGDLRARGVSYWLDPEASRQAWTGLYAEFLRREGVPDD